MVGLIHSNQTCRQPLDIGDLEERPARAGLLFRADKPD
jgi:hypothetical protein